MPEGVEIRIGNQTRELRFGIQQVLAAERLLGGEELQTIALTRLSLLNLTKIAAAGFSTFGKDQKRIAPLQVQGWITDEPTIVPALEKAVVLAVSLHLLEVGKMNAEETKAMGEALASGAPGSAGTNGSSASEGSASPPPKPTT